MFSIGPNLSDQYFGLADEVNALAAYSAIAPNIQSTNALATWKTDQVGPLSEHNLLKNNVVLLDDAGNMEGLSSSKYVPKATQTDQNMLYINSSNNHLWRGGLDLETVSGGDVIAPPIQTSTALPTWGAPNTLTNSTVLLDASANITGVGTLKLLDKTAITDPNTLWINQLDGHLYRGPTDLESYPGDVTTTIPIGTAVDGNIIASSGSTGAYIKEAPISTNNGDLALLTPGSKLKMYDNNSSTVLPILYTDGLSTVTGFGNCFNSPVSPNEAVIFGSQNDLSGKLETSVCIGNSNFGSLTGPSFDNVVAGEYCCTSLLSGGANIAAGYGVLPLLTSGSSNISIGSGSGPTLVNGSSNIYIGDQTGLATESDTTRIGNNSTSRTYIKGVHSQTVNNKAKLTGITSSGVLEDSNIFFDSSTDNLHITSSNVPAQNVGVTANVLAGTSVLSVASTANNNIMCGRNLCTTTTTGCNNNVMLGSGSCVGPTASFQNNVCVGTTCMVLNGAINLSSNVILGNSCLQNANGASGNIIIGNGSGNGITANINNIIISGTGTAGRDNSIEIGTSGTHTSCYLQGITPNPLSNKKIVVTDTTTGQLGYEDPMHMAVAETYYESYVSPYVLPLIVNVPSELAFTQTLVTNMPMDFDATVNGRLKWTNATTSMFHCAFSMSATLAAGSNQDCAFYVALNGVKVPGSEIRRRLQSTTVNEMIVFHKVVTVAQNQYISLFATNLTGSNGISFNNVNMVMMGVH